MAYHSRAALSDLVQDTCLEPQTSIELLRLTYDRDLGRSILDVHDTFGNEILERITAPDYAKHDAPNIQLLQVFRSIQAS